MKKLIIYYVKRKLILNKKNYLKKNIIFYLCLNLLYCTFLIELIKS